MEVKRGELHRTYGRFCMPEPRKHDCRCRRGEEDVTGRVELRNLLLLVWIS